MKSADVTNNEIFTGGRLSELTFADIKNEIAKSELLDAKSAGNT